MTPRLPSSLPAERTKRYRTPYLEPHVAKGPPRVPQQILGADWQAGVTADNDDYRVLLDGLPQRLAFAASVSRGWVLVYEESASGHRIQRTLGPENPDGSDAAFRCLCGVVKIVRS